MIVPAILGAAVVLALLTVDVAAYLAEEREHAGRDAATEAFGRALGRFRRG